MEARVGDDHELGQALELEEPVQRVRQRRPATDVEERLRPIMGDRTEACRVSRGKDVGLQVVLLRREASTIGRVHVY